MRCKKGKGELFVYLRSKTEAFAFVMWDYDYLQEMCKGISGIIKYGTNEEAHIVGKIISHAPFLNVEIMQGLAPVVIQSQLVGDYNLSNILAAVTVGKFFEVNETKIKSALKIMLLE